MHIGTRAILARIGRCRRHFYHGNSAGRAVRLRRADLAYSPEEAFP